MNSPGSTAPDTKEQQNAAMMYNHIFRVLANAKSSETDTNSGLLFLDLSSVVAPDVLASSIFDRRHSSRAVSYEFGSMFC